MEMKSVSSRQVCQLLHNKFIVVLGDSIQRAVYKDIVLLLQRDKYLTSKQLKSKGEMSFEQDCLVEGGSLGQMHNGTEYREVRQYQSAHHLVRFYFVTRIYSRYMQSILEDFRHGLKPDIVFVNSCVWDISRYCSQWIADYKENLHKFMEELRENVPEETLAVWNLTMPLGKGIKGGFLVPEIEHRAAHLRYDVIEANFYSGTLADAYGMDVLDLHFQFRFSLQHRTKDGVHWNAIAHRRITNLLLQHTAQAWGVDMPVTDVEHTGVTVTVQQPACGNAPKHAGGFPVERASNYNCPPPTNHFPYPKRYPSAAYHDGYSAEFYDDSLSFSFLDFEDNSQNTNTFNQQSAEAYRPAPPPQFNPPVYRPRKRAKNSTGIEYRHPNHSETYINHQYENQHQYVMRSRHSRHHYAPYTHERPRQYERNGRFY